MSAAHVVLTFVTTCNTKILDRHYLCNTIIGMAKVHSSDKQSRSSGSLAEGSSILSIERITGVNLDTVMRLGVRVGQECTTLLDQEKRDFWSVTDLVEAAS